MSDETISLTEVYEDIVGLAEVAEGLGVQKFRVNRWVERRESVGCPKPVRVLKLGHLYSMTEWRGWYALWKVTRGAHWAQTEND